MSHILAEVRPTAVAFSARLGRDRRPADEMAVLLERLGIEPRARYAVGDAVPG